MSVYVRMCVGDYVIDIYIYQGVHMFVCVYENICVYAGMCVGVR